MTKWIATSLLGASLLCGGTALAKRPSVDVSGKRHPNLHRAQVACDNAFKAVTAAQTANEFDMEGHAAKAKELLEQASNELKQAAEAANKNAK